MPTRDVKKARAAFKNNDITLMQDAHQQQPPEAHKKEQGKYIKSIIYGGLDGIITTFAVLPGSLSPVALFSF